MEFPKMKCYQSRFGKSQVGEMLLIKNLIENNHHGICYGLKEVKEV